MFPGASSIRSATRTLSSPPVMSRPRSQPPARTRRLLPVADLMPRPERKDRMISTMGRPKSATSTGAAPGDLRPTPLPSRTLTTLMLSRRREQPWILGRSEPLPSRLSRWVKQESFVVNKVGAVMGSGQDVEELRAGLLQIDKGVMNINHD